MITFVTGNKNKIRELSSVLGDVFRAVDIDLPEIQSLSFEDVIGAKLKEARKSIQDGDIMVEDSGYVFHGLGTLPGPFSKFFLESLGLTGIYSLVSSLSSNKATFYSHIGYMDKTGIATFFDGATPGTIVTPEGEGGFGFDPLFIPDGYTKRFAEMTEEERQTVKPRILAAKKLKEYLKNKES